MEKYTQKKTPITYYGGKQLMCKHILPNLPKHITYVEPFCGGAAVFFAKEPSNLEILNDTNKEIVNFYEQLKNNFIELQKKVQITMHARTAHKDAWTIYNSPHLFKPIDRAWALWVLSAQGFGGLLSSTWGRDKKRNKAGKMVRNKRDHFSEHLAIRLQDVELEARDAIKLVKSLDYSDAFFYCDPPYYNADMAHYDGYTLEDFEMLLQALSKVEGKFLLSSYPSDILTKYTKEHNWHNYNVEMRVLVRSKGKQKTEVLTANYPLKEIQ